jgi:multidrug resistance efflux pump
MRASRRDRGGRSGGDRREQVARGFRRTQHLVAEANVKLFESRPRAEEVPPLDAIVATVESELADWEDQYERLKQAQADNGASDNELKRRWFQMQVARGRLEQAKANLTLTKAGAWAPELEVARAQLEQAKAGLESIRVLLDRRTVRAPIDATILKRSVEPGQFAPADQRSSAMTLGDLSALHVRARVDEEDLPRLKFGSRGVARIRGDQELTVPLTMVRIEPLALPKSDLSGATTERVDTRVVEVIFQVSGTPPVPLYPGQLVDVFIDGGEQ